jgi:NAD(P)-dependent dehydrogenase (short-subunit alcohol dehydrogenase family)
MRVLVTAASRHGGTTSISREVARLLHEAGHAAYLADPDEVNRLDGGDAVVLGSAVHGGRLDDTLLSRGERARARRARVTPGDYREWAEIRCWAEGLAYKLDQQELAARVTRTEESQP